jgi:hypothetical protein
MSSPTDAARGRAAVETVIVLAGLLERLERRPGRIDADAHRTVVERLGRALAAPELPADALDAVLGAHPAAAQLYENLHYAHAGLLRSPLEAAVAAERQARELLERVARVKPSSSPASPAA